MSQILPPAYWALTAAILLWDVQLGGRIAQNRRVARPLALMSGVVALLVIPAAVVAAAAPSLLSGRAVRGIAWLWPVVTALCTLQVLYTLVRRHVTPAVGIPFLVHDVVLTAVAIARYQLLSGGEPAAWVAGLSAAHASALGVLLGEPALYSPLALHPPLIAPVTPARWRLSAGIRAGLAVFATAWAALVLVVEYPRSVRAVRAFDTFADARLQERPAGDFAIGLRVFPPLDDPPTPLVLANDLSLLDSLDASVVSLTIDPAGARPVVLDSVARLLEPVRRDTLMLVVSLGYPRDARAAWRASPEGYTEARMRELREVLRRLRPDIVIPAVDPYGQGERAVGDLPVEAWERYFATAAQVVQEVRPRTQLAMSLGTFDSRDSVLHAWAASRASPVETVGFALFPGFDGGLSLRARMSAIDRWLDASVDPERAPKPHWIFSAGAYPLAHGEEAQRDALWGMLAWATTHPTIRGLIVADAADYTRITGLRATSGRVRPAAAAVAQAVVLLRETVQ
ncbi:MAG TPA: hypothetical protein VFX39_07315 [Gemmatimonadaceae bacterium]|nr:hypothetical protein [Gemmatimonadaceae bacterium]